MATIPGTLNTQLTDEQVLEAFDNALKHTPSDSTPKEDGSGSAGEEETFARSDHEHPHDTTKQDTLAFEGTYNASTNKAATMSAVKDGKLTGYAQASGDVAATDKIIEAIGKVEKKADDNKTNISKDEAALVELIDTGAKNIYKITNVPTVSGVTIAKTGDSTVSINGTFSQSTYVFFTLSGDNVFLPAGEYVVATETTGTMPARTLTISAGIASVTLGSSAEFTLSEEKQIGLYVQFLSNDAPNGTIRIMICTKAVWDISHTYQPYALPNTKITPELIDLVDSGAKNKIFVDKLNTTNANGVTYTINNDGTITANGTPSGTSPSYVVVATPDGSTYKNFSEFCNGDNVLSGCPSGGSSSTYRMYITGTGYAKEDFGNGIELSATSVSPLYLIIYIYNGYTANNLTFKPMICSKSAWDVSQKYVPYCPSNYELYQMILNL